MKVKTWRKGQERNKAKGRWYDKENKEKDERIERKVVRQGKKETGKRKEDHYKHLKDNITLSNNKKKKWKKSKEKENRKERMEKIMKWIKSSEDKDRGIITTESNDVDKRIDNGIRKNSGKKL